MARKRRAHTPCAAHVHGQVFSALTSARSRHFCPMTFPLLSLMSRRQNDVQGPHGIIT